MVNVIIVVPQVRKKRRKKDKRGKKQKNMRIDRSKENTLIYIHIYMHSICTNIHGHSNIDKQTHVPINIIIQVDSAFLHYI